MFGQRLSRMRARLAPRRVWLSLLGGLVLAGFLAGGLAQLQVRTDLDSFLPNNDSVLRQTDELARSFGADPIVVLVHGRKPDQQLDGQHLMPLVRLEGKLSKLPDSAVVYGPGTTLNQIAGQTQDLLAELTGRRDGIRDQAISAAKQRGLGEAGAKEAGEAAAAQFDARYGKLLVQALPSGLPTLHNANFVKAAVYGAGGSPKPQWRFIIPNRDSVAVLVRPRQGLDEAAAHRLVAQVRQAVADAKLDAADVHVSGVPALISALGDKVRSEIPLLGTAAIIAVGACFLLIPWTRWRRRLLPVCSTVIAVGLTLAVFGWLDKPVSLGVAAFLPALLGIGSYYPTYFAQRAGKRLVLAVVAGTSASFATLLFTPLPFVQDLGLSMAIGVLLAALSGMVLYRLLPVESAPVAEWRIERQRGYLARWGPLALLGVAAVAGWALLPGLGVEASVDKLAAGLPEMNQARSVESTIGSSGELDVVLRGPDVLSPEAVGWAQRAQDVAIAKHGDQLHTVVSPPTLLPFLGANPSAEQIQAGVRLLPSYLTGSIFRSDNKVALLSFGVKLDDLGTLQGLRDDLRASLPPPPKGYHVQLSGLPMVAVHGNQLLSKERVFGNIAGILAAGAVLSIGLRRRADAGRAVLAAALATGSGLFLLWLFGIPLSPITVCLGSLTATVGCEFTVLLAEARRSRSAGLYRSVLLAATSSAVGYAVLLVSGLAAIAQFGALLAGSVVLALISASCVVAATRVRPNPRIPGGKAGNETGRLAVVGAQS